MSRIGRTLRLLFRKEELDRDMDEELQSFLDLLTEEKIKEGMNPGEARRAARLELGGVEQVKVDIRENRFGGSIDTLLQDIRYAIRSLMKNPGFAAVAVLILAIGIGANTALFSTINTVLLRPIPFEQPDRLVFCQKTLEGRIAGTVSRVDYFDFRELGRSFEDLAALTDFTTQQTITGDTDPEAVQTGFVTWNLFRTLGVNAVAGRWFLPEEEARGDARVVVVSYSFWQRRFGGSMEAVGSVINLNGSPYTIVGVMPQGFRFLFDADLWRLVDRDGPFDTHRDSHSHFVVGRLKPGVSIEQAQSEVDAISRALAQQYPDTNETKGLHVAGLHGFMVGEIRSSLLLLMITTALVLLIACGNVAGLLLARGQRRLSEMAMRSALGASRRRLVRQLLTESVILTSLAGLAGVAVAYLLQDLLLRLLPTGRLGIDATMLDEEALLFTLLVSVATGLVVGIVPALRGTAMNLSQQLKTGTHASEGTYGTRLRSGLVVLQIAVSVVLLIGSGLLIRSMVQLATVDLGFEPENLLTGQVQIQTSEYPTIEERNAFFTSLLEEIETLPGVVSATMINKLPIHSPWMDWSVWPTDRPSPSTQDSYSAMARWVPPGYFETMRIPLLEGRDISRTDGPGTPRALVVSESVARTLFPGQSPIGRTVDVGSDWPPPFEVVGVVGDARVNTLRGEPGPVMYMAAAQMGDTRMRVVVRSSGDPTQLVGPIRQMLRQKDPNVLFTEPFTMTSIIEDALADFRIVILSLGLFSMVALVLTAIGLYGVLAYNVSQRTNEIGIRLAVGASRSDMLGLVLKRGLLLVGMGLILGVAGTYPGTLFVRQLLYETQPLDAASYAGAIGFLAVVAFLACVLPALRATRVNLADVLRRE